MKRLRSCSLAFKLRLIESVKFGGFKQSAVADLHQIPRSCLCKWIKSYETIKHLVRHSNGDKTRRFRIPSVANSPCVSSLWNPDDKVIFMDKVTFFMDHQNSTQNFPAASFQLKNGTCSKWSSISAAMVCLFPMDRPEWRCWSLSGNQSDSLQRSAVALMWPKLGRSL